MSWPLVSLRELIVEERSGASLKKYEFTESGIPVVPKKAISDSVDLLVDTFVHTSKEKFNASSNAQVTSEYLVTTLRNLNPDGSTLGLICRQNVQEKFMLAQGMYAFKVSERVDANYLCYASRRPEFRGAIQKVKVGSTQVHIRARELKEVEIPLPPLAEQKRIAAILDKADNLRRKRQQAIQLADDFLRAVFLDMFGDPESQGWEFTTVENMAAPEKGSMRTGPFGSDLKHSEFTEEGISVLGIDNAVKNKFSWGKDRFISPEKYEQLKRYTVKPGDVMITIMGTCGRCAVVPDDIPTAINTKHLCCITLDQSKCLPSFMHAYFLMHPVARKYLAQTAKGAIMDGLNMGIIKSLPIPKIPIGLQRKYEAICKEASNAVGLSSKSLIESNAAFSSLSQQAFSGNL